MTKTPKKEESKALKSQNTPKIKKRKPRIERVLKKQEPLLTENTKRLLIMKGKHTSQIIVEVLRDLARLSKPNCKLLTRHNDILPFEDVNSLEFLSSKNDCSLVALGSHSKKRPNNIIMSRMYDGHVLDLIEFGVTSFQSMESIPGQKKGIASKPCLLFLGDQWSHDNSFLKIQNFFIDYFRGDKVDKISLQGIDHVMSFSVVDGKIFIRTYVIVFERSGTKVPTIALEEMGPNMDLVVRRTQFASNDLMKLACRQPASTKVKKTKNIKETGMGEKVGRLHIQRQDLDKLGGRRVEALRTRNPKRDPPTDADASSKSSSLGRGSSSGSSDRKWSGAGEAAADSPRAKKARKAA